MTRAGVPLRLPSPAPTWVLDVDVVVIGSGAAGLAAALAVRNERSNFAGVIIFMYLHTAAGLTGSKMTSGLALRS